MSAGRPPKPAAIRIAEGNRSRRPINGRELMVPFSMPEAPEWLDADALLHWERLSRVLEDLGCSHDADQATMASLCIALATLAEARSQLAELPKGQRLVVKMPGGAVTENPLVGTIRRQIDQIHRLGADFGLSPVARVKLLRDDMPVGEAPALEDILAPDQARADELRRALEIN